MDVFATKRYVNDISLSSSTFEVVAARKEFFLTENVTHAADQNKYRLPRIMQISSLFSQIEILLDQIAV